MCSQQHDIFRLLLGEQESLLAKAMYHAVDAVLLRAMILWYGRSYKLSLT